MVRAAPSGLRFWITVDHRTNDSSSVCGICEACNISIHCDPLYPKCNRISNNKSMNMTPSSPIHRRQRHFVAPTANLCTPNAIIFVSIKARIWHYLRRYIEGSAILLTVKGPLWPRWLNISPCVTTKIMWNNQAIYSKHNIYNYKFLLWFQDI